MPLCLRPDAGGRSTRGLRVACIRDEDPTVLVLPVRGRSGQPLRNWCTGPCGPRRLCFACVHLHLFDTVLVRHLARCCAFSRGIHHWVYPNAPAATSTISVAIKNVVVLLGRWGRSAFGRGCRVAGRGGHYLR